MKVTFVGTGSMGNEKQGNTSLLIDNILIDCGMGVVKAFERMGHHTREINYVVITHFHADHVFDIPNFLAGREIRGEFGEKLTFIGPKGLKERIKDLIILAFADTNPGRYSDIEQYYNIKIVELEDGKSIDGEDFKLTAYKLDHGINVEEQGYILEKDNKKLGILWDTTLCSNYYDVCSKVDYVFSDTGKEETTASHIGVKDYNSICKEYPNTKFYAVHRGNYNTDILDYRIIVPKDGEEINL
jgi:ribonuclease BN (tRNA processing enzyme)